MNDNIIKAMEKAGFYYDDINSYEGWYIFNGDYCTKMEFTSESDIINWLENVVLE